MNFNQFLNMVTRIVMNRVINTGINYLFRSFSRTKAGGAAAAQTPEDRKLSADARAAAKRARQAAKITRRLGR